MALNKEYSIVAFLAVRALARPGGQVKRRELKDAIIKAEKAVGVEYSEKLRDHLKARVTRALASMGAVVVP